MGADAFIGLLVRHLASYVELGTAAAGEMRNALARRVACALAGMTLAIVGLLALWASGLISVWDTTWRMPYAAFSGLLLVIVAIVLLRSATANGSSGPSAGILRSELQKDMELFQQWKSTQ
jgi:hypothetical protein